MKILIGDGDGDGGWKLVVGSFMYLSANYIRVSAFMSLSANYYIRVSRNAASESALVTNIQLVTPMCVRLTYQQGQYPPEDVQ